MCIAAQERSFKLEFQFMFSDLRRVAGIKAKVNSKRAKVNSNSSYNFQQKQYVTSILKAVFH